MTDPEATVLYDQDCGFCKWSLDKILAWDRSRKLRPVPIQSDEGQRLLAAVPEEQRLDSWHLVEPSGEVRSAGAAARAALRPPAGGRPLAGSGPSASRPDRARLPRRRRQPRPSGPLCSTRCDAELLRSRALSRRTLIRSKRAGIPQASRRRALPDRRQLACLPRVLRAPRVDRDGGRAADQRDLRLRLDDGQAPGRLRAGHRDRRLGQGHVRAREGVLRVQGGPEVAARTSCASSGLTWSRSPRRSASPTSTSRATRPTT